MVVVVVVVVWRYWAMADRVRNVHILLVHSDRKNCAHDEKGKLTGGKLKRSYVFIVDGFFFFFKFVGKLWTVPIPDLYTEK